MQSLRNIRRDWPILYVLYKLGKVYNNFHLQKFIYLAKVEANIPIQYTFMKFDYGPYDRTIKNDALNLSLNGYIQMHFDTGWVFEITHKGNLLAKELISKVPIKYRDAFDTILTKFKGYSLCTLKQYVYNHHIRPHAKNEVLKRSLTTNLKKLLGDFELFPPSHNSTFICGALDYSILALKKEKISDPVQKDHLLRLIYAFANEMRDIYDKVGNDKTLLAKLDLRDSEEQFQLIQSVCSELNILPTLDEDFDLAILAET